MNNDSLDLLNPTCSPVTLSVSNFLSHISSHSTIYVAYSGGLDSTVLLHSIYSSPIRFEKHIAVVALYVDHGLQEDSKGWEKHCSKFCHDRGIDFIALQVMVENTARKGVEAEARRLRYQAILKAIDGSLKTSLLGEVFLLTGHHQRDQAETVLLNLFRGAGVNGLAAMPANKKLFTEGQVQVNHVRPMIYVRYDEIVAYASDHALMFVTDKSNDQTDYKRNAVRHNVLSVLEEVWPNATNALSKTAVHMQEALSLLDSYAEESLQELVDSAYFLDLQSFTDMSWFKQKNIIRYWFKSHWPQVVLSEVHYQWIEQSLANYTRSQNHNFTYQLSTGCLRVYQDRLYYIASMPAVFCIQLSSLSISCGKSSLYFKINALENFSNIVVRSITPSDSVKRKSLKRFFQQNKIPVWERSVWPVLEVNGVLVSVLGCEDCLLGHSEQMLEANQCKRIQVDYNQLLKWWAVLSDLVFSKSLGFSYFKLQLQRWIYKL